MIEEFQAQGVLASLQVDCVFYITFGSGRIDHQQVVDKELGLAAMQEDKGVFAAGWYLDGARPVDGVGAFEGNAVDIAVDLGLDAYQGRWSFVVGARVVAGQ